MDKTYFLLTRHSPFIYLFSNTIIEDFHPLIESHKISTKLVQLFEDVQSQNSPFPPVLPKQSSDWKVFIWVSRERLNQIKIENLLEQSMMETFPSLLLVKAIKGLQISKDRISFHAFYDQYEPYNWRAPESCNLSHRSAYATSNIQNLTQTKSYIS